MDDPITSPVISPRPDRKESGREYPIHSSVSSGRGFTTSAADLCRLFANDGFRSSSHFLWAACRRWAKNVGLSMIRILKPDNPGHWWLNPIHSGSEPYRCFPFADSGPDDLRWLSVYHSYHRTWTWDFVTFTLIQAYCSTAGTRHLVTFFTLRPPLPMQPNKLLSGYDERLPGKLCSRTRWCSKLHTWGRNKTNVKAEDVDWCHLPTLQKP